MKTHEEAHRQIRDETDAQAHERSVFHGGERYVVDWVIAGTHYQRVLAAHSGDDAIDRVKADVGMSIVAYREATR